MKSRRHRAIEKNKKNLDQFNSALNELYTKAYKKQMTKSLKPSKLEYFVLKKKEWDRKSFIERAKNKTEWLWFE